MPFYKRLDILLFPYWVTKYYPWFAHRPPTRLLCTVFSLVLLWKMLFFIYISEKKKLNSPRFRSGVIIARCFHVGHKLTRLRLHNDLWLMHLCPSTCDFSHLWLVVSPAWNIAQNSTCDFRKPVTQDCLPIQPGLSDCHLGRYRRKKRLLILNVGSTFIILVNVR